LGSIRIPAACCGLFGLKPGVDLIPLDVGRHNWHGFTENGPLTTTVEDAALLLSVMAGRAELREVREPAQPLRIAVSTRAPGPGIRVNAEFVRNTHAAAQLLRAAGHSVETADPPYSTRIALAVLGHWFAAARQDSEPLERNVLEPRTRRHAQWGPTAERLGLVGPHWREEWRRRVQPLFDRYDVLLTPTLAQLPIKADAWASRSWLSNLLSNMRYAPFCASWNLAGYPAASIPLGVHSSGLPASVQLVALPGREALLLGLASQLERQQPWSRHAPMAFAQ
jgi:amidase